MRVELRSCLSPDAECHLLAIAISRTERVSTSALLLNKSEHCKRHNFHYGTGRLVLVIVRKKKFFYTFVSTCSLISCCNVGHMFCILLATVCGMRYSCTLGSCRPIIHPVDVGLYHSHDKWTAPNIFRRTSGSCRRVGATLPEQKPVELWSRRRAPTTQAES